MTYDKNSIIFEPLPTHPQFIDRTKDVYTRLTVIGYAGKDGCRQLWWCECECGGLVKARQGNLHSGQVQSCGCLRDEKIGALNRTHGLSQTHPLYVTWCNMRRRCYDVNFPKYQTHGKRGIKVCQRWRDSFPNFLKDMGDTKPSRTHSIERIENDGNYSCGHCAECFENGWMANCEWGTPVIQANNQRSNHLLTYNDKTQTMAQWAREIGLSYGCLSARINKRKWSDEKALTTPKTEQTRSSYDSTE